MKTHFKSNVQVTIDTFENITGYPEIRLLEFNERPEQDMSIAEGEYFYTDNEGVEKQIKRFVLTFTDAEVNYLASTFNVSPNLSEVERRAALRAAGTLHVLQSELRWGLKASDWTQIFD